ncbi:hypothetical protein PMAYCL1PPCAC_16800, partial [Pristionchus mayeri]
DASSRFISGHTKLEKGILNFVWVFQCMNMGPIVLAILIFRLKILRTLDSSATIMSERTRHQHRNLTNV